MKRTGTDGNEGGALLIDADDALELLPGIPSKARLYAHVREGHIPAVRLGKRVLFSPTRLRELALGQESAPEGGEAA